MGVSEQGGLPSPLEVLREDLAVNAPVAAKLVLISLRVRQAGLGAHGLVRWALRIVGTLLTVLVDMPQGCEIDPRARIGRRLRLPHGGNGIVVSSHSELSDDVVLYHQVTIGNSDIGARVFGAPVVSKGVTIYPGAKVFGPVRIGSEAIIGANAVVVRDVPAAGIVGAVPARSVTRRKEPS